MTTLTIPAGPDALTPDWLTSALRSGGQISRAAVTSAACTPIGQGVGILCRLFRLDLVYDQQEDGAPASVVVKMPSAEEQARGLSVMFKFYEREVRFYQELAGEVALPTPRLYYAAFDPATSDFVLLIEDLSGCRLGDQLAGASVEDARLLVTEIANLHAQWWNNPRLDQAPWLPTSGSEVNKAGMSLYPMAWGPFMERWGHRLPERIRTAGERLSTQSFSILERFSAPGRSTTLLHGDYRLDNFFFGKSTNQPPLTVVDWQISIRGAAAYDVGYFTGQSLSIEDRRTHERDLLALYLDTLKSGGVTDYSMDQLLDDYRWTLMFCFAYPVMGGGLGDIANERGFKLAEAMMERSAAAITDWDADTLLAAE